jgi:hypothetical protein
MRLRLGASGAERLCALGAIRRFWAAPQLHSKDFPVVSTVDAGSGSLACRDSVEREGQTASL